MKLRKDLYFSAWKFTYQAQLRALYDRIGKAVVQPQANEGSSITPYASEFGDFCLAVFIECPELIDYTQN